MGGKKKKKKPRGGGTNWLLLGTVTLQALILSSGNYKTPPKMKNPSLPPTPQKAEKERGV